MKSGFTTIIYERMQVEGILFVDRGVYVYCDYVEVCRGMYSSSYYYYM